MHSKGTHDQRVIAGANRYLFAAYVKEKTDSGMSYLEAFNAVIAEKPELADRVQRAVMFNIRGYAEGGNDDD